MVDPSTITYILLQVYINFFLLSVKRENAFPHTLQSECTYNPCKVVSDSTALPLDKSKSDRLHQLSMTISGYTNSGGNKPDSIISVDNKMGIHGM